MQFILSLSKSDIIRLCIDLVVCIGVILLVVGIFRRHPKPDDTYKQVIASKDETIKAVEQQRDIYKQWKEDITVQINDHLKKDSVLFSQSKKNDIRYEKIPVYIMSLSRDSLRSAVYQY